MTGIEIPPEALKDNRERMVNNAGTAKRRTTDEWVLAIGAALRDQRLDAGITQEELARRAEISVGAIKGIEGGKGSTLRSLIRAARVLNFEQWMEAIVSASSPAVSPMQLLREQQGMSSPRQRAPKRLT